MIARSKISLMLVSATLLISCVSMASAQGRRGGMGMMGRGNPMMLLRNKSVQEELKMTQPQIAKLDSKQQEMMQSMRDLFQSGQGDPDARRAMMAKIQEMQQKAVADILDTTQQKRFKQIQLQQEGPAAITRKEIADELQLTEEQRKKAQGIQQDEQEQTRSLMQGVDFRNQSPEERQEFMKKIQALQKASGEKYAALLTDPHKVQWKKMLGEPFKLVVPERGA
jgi:hypothetical protein